MSSYAGTSRLIRLALRRDRIKLPIWIISIVGIVGASAGALGSTYGTYQQQLVYAQTVASSVVGRAFGGVMDGVSLGAITMVELFYFSAVLFAFMSTLCIVRHTRQNEEKGSAEIISSARVGRFSAITAALVVATFANIITGLLVGLILAQVDQLSTAGAFGFGTAQALIGIAFAGIAAITAQLAESARGANSLASSAIGIAFLLRAIGDGFATVSADGLTSTATWPTWLSPFGWGYQIFPFGEQHWWIFGLLSGFIVVTIISAFVLISHRDLGLGIIPSRAGRKYAKASLLSSAGLAKRLLRGVFFGWLAFFVVMGAVIGGMAQEFDALVADNEFFQEYLATAGSNASASELLFNSMYLMMGIVAVGYMLQSLLKMRSEETTGHAELLLSTHMGRLKWLWSNLSWVLTGSVALLLVFGVMSSTTYVLIANLGISEVWNLTSKALVVLPATFALASLAILSFGWLPRFAVAISWGVFAAVLLVNQLGALLDLPQWVLNVSPFTHVPAVFGGDIAWQPLIILGSISVTLTLIGAYGLRNRDLSTD